MKNREEYAEGIGRDVGSTAKLTKPVPRRILPIALEILALRIRCRRTPAFYSFMAMGNWVPSVGICAIELSATGSKLIGSAFFRMVAIHSEAPVTATSRNYCPTIILGREVRHQCR